MKRERRVIVHTPEPAAGAGQYVAEFVKALAGAGTPTVLFCPANFAYQREVLESGAEIVRAPIREVHSAGFWRRVFRNIDFAVGAARKFGTTVRKGDIVHFQFASHLRLGLLFFLIARVRGASIVMTAHDPLPHRWVLPPGLRWLETAALTSGYWRSDRIIVHNEAGKRLLVERFRCNASCVVVIPHGPLNVAAPAGPAMSADGPAAPLRLLAFGSLRQNKGLHLSIGAVQHFRRSVLQSAANREVVLTIAGAVPNLAERAYWNSCLRLIASQPDGIEVIERVIDDAEIGPLFKMHDAVILPYVDFTSDSGVAMLALSRQLPILATSAGGLGELLRESDCGIPIDSPTVNGVIAALEAAAAMPARVLRSKGMTGYSHVLTCRSWNVIAQRTVEVYDGLFAREVMAGAGCNIVLHTPEPASSAALYLDALSAALADENIPVRVVCPANHQAREAMERNPLIDVRPCRARATKRKVSIATKIAENVFFIVSSSRALLEATKKCDVVHFQYILHLPFGLIFFLCAWVRHARIVFTVHDPVPHKFLFPKILRGIETVTLGWAYRWSDVLIVHSEAGKRSLMETFRVSAGKIRVIVHGPYQLKQKVAPCGEEARLEVLFFGSLRENKAPHLAIEAVQKLAAEGAPIRLTIAGQVVNRKEEAYWERSRALIDSASGAIRLIETFVPDEALLELFSNCHCFLLPYTTFSSDSGVAYMALANCKPIVSTAAGGLGWLLENSAGGILIHEATADGVIAALRHALDLGAENLECMGRAGADWVLGECGWPVVARRTREVYAAFIPQLGAAPTSAEDQSAAVELAGACHE